MKRVPFILLVAAILLLYLLFPTRTHYWDGVLFSLYIEGVHKGLLPVGILFHPNHLLYSALGYIVYKALLACGFSLRAITALQILNVVLSALSAWILFGFAKRLTRSMPAAAFCAILFAFGATWWRFSTDADSYVIALLFLLLTVRSVAGKNPQLFPAALCQIAAMLFHELAVFAYVPVIVAIALDTRRTAAKRFWLGCIYVFSTAACTAAIYLVAYQYSDHAAYPSLFSWVVSRSAASQTTHALKQFPGAYLLSYVKLFGGGKLSLIRDFFSAAEVLAFAICAACIGFAIYLFRKPAAENATVVDVKAVRVLWAWLVPYALFFAWWEPASAFYKLFVWPPIVLSIGIYTRRHSRAMLTLAVGIAAWNFGAFIFPHSHASADPVLALAQQIDRGLPKNATVYYQVLDPDDWYLEYFAPGRRWVKLPSNPRAVSGLTGTSESPVCLETTALDQAERGFGLRLAIDPARRWDLVNRQHNVRLECLQEQ